MESFGKIPKALIITAIAIGFAVVLLSPPQLPMVVRLLDWLRNF
jgi:multisubunit Na+/H+ antiporter MnhC subunit